MSSLILAPKGREINTLISQGEVKYTSEDHKTWAYLYKTQLLNLQNFSYPKILEYTQKLSLPKNSVPQLEEVSQKLYEKTGWQICEVVDLIDGEMFFQLLSNRIFPSTSYIRGRDELSISRDPDIFHDLFGHCPILLDEMCADLFQKFGLLGLRLDQVQRSFLQRLFWFTFETGLTQTKQGIKIYGGSLLSSIKESRYAIEDPVPRRREFNISEVFRTSFRADLLQPIYYAIQHFEQLHTIYTDEDALKKNIEIAYELGEFFPLFPIDIGEQKYMSYNICRFVHQKPSDL